MPLPTQIWETSRSWTNSLGATHYKSADPIELRRLTSLSSGYSLDTSYNSHHALATEPDIDSSAEGKGNVYGVPSRYLSGWRFGAINCALSASVVFIINLVVTIWGTVHNRSHGGLLFEGDCERVRIINVGLHIIINLLSTLLLSSSNYCMQCLSAPTRTEVDEAHSKRIWLDIGVPSVHNLRRISTRRLIIWCFLGLSSLPLHLFYNSAVYSSISANDYEVLTVSESFVENSDCPNCETYGMAPMLHEKARNGSLERLTNSDCIREYAELIQTKRRSVLVILRNESADPLSNHAIHTLTRVSAAGASFSISAARIYDWICSGLRTDEYSFGCTTAIDKVQSSPETWEVEGYTVEYCLSEKADQHCRLRFIPSIAILVTVLNLFKATLIFYTAFGTVEEPLMTMGDAVVSFLENEDPTTKGMCLLSVHDVKDQRYYFPAGPRQWTGEQRRWKDVTSRTRRSVTLGMFLLAAGIVCGLLIFGIVSLPSGMSRSIISLAQLGYGAIDPRTIITFAGIASPTIIQNILIANAAQPILSFLYFSYNGLFTCMLLGLEWVSYAHIDKGLRVSRASSGAQRSTYFLQLPYRFALPLMILSGILHWLVSQSIFITAIDIWASDGTGPEHYYKSQGASTSTSSGWTSCGYSPIAIFTVLILVVVMTITVYGIGWVPYKEGMNLAGSCSAAISAACHLPEGGVDGHTAALEKLKWGVVGVDAEGVGHCSFSTDPVEMPTKGRWYAGSKTRLRSARHHLSGQREVFNVGL